MGNKQEPQAPPKSASDQLFETIFEFKSQSRELHAFEMNKVPTAADLSDYLMKLMNQAKKSRMTNKTDMNNHSSRSHAFFQFCICSSTTEQDKVIDKMGTITFVDLAGSEKTDKQAFDQKNKRLENISINKSLTALRDVLVALSKKDPHIPYRNSKLTSLMQSYLGQDAKSLIIINLCANSKYFYQTKNSLDFGQAIPKICNGNGLKRNIQVTPKHEWSEPKFQITEESAPRADSYPRKPSYPAPKRPNFQVKGNFFSQN